MVHFDTTNRLDWISNAPLYIFSPPKLSSAYFKLVRLKKKQLARNFLQIDTTKKTKQEIILWEEYFQ